MVYEDFKYFFSLEKLAYRVADPIRYCIFDKTSAATHKKTEFKFDVVSENQKLVEELDKPIIRKFEKQKDNIWGADLADMQLISK